MVKKGKKEFIVKFQDESLKKMEALKKYYDIQSNAELIKILVNEKAQQLTANPTEAITDATQ
jgi:hypothetical protein